MTGIDFSEIEGKKCEGDSPILTADPTKIKNDLSWNPKYNDVSFIIKIAWDWEIKFSPVVASKK